jgi:hypothetical protein
MERMRNARALNCGELVGEGVKPAALDTTDVKATPGKRGG